MKLKIIAVLLTLVVATVCIAGCVTIHTEEIGTILPDDNNSGVKPMSVFGTWVYEDTTAKVVLDFSDDYRFTMTHYVYDGSTYYSEMTITGKFILYSETEYNVGQSAVGYAETFHAVSTDGTIYDTSSEGYFLRIELISNTVAISTLFGEDDLKLQFTKVF